MHCAMGHLDHDLLDHDLLLLYPQAGQTHAPQSPQPMPSCFLRQAGGVR